MSEKWAVELSEHNAALMRVGDCTHFAHVGIGRYVFDIPSRLYKNYEFNFTAQLNAPAVPGVKCKIYYHFYVNCQLQDRPTDLSKSGDCTLMVGYLSVFNHGMSVQSTKHTLSSLGFPAWKACLVVEFLSPDDTLCDPGKWSLHLDFSFESVEKIREAARKAAQKKKADEELEQMTARMKLEAAAKKPQTPTTILPTTNLCD